MAKHGRGSGSGASPAARAPMTDGKTPAVAQPAKRRRGAPQTFSSKLYKILQDAQLKESSPVGWCLEGKSFTVHNDKDFETQVLAANYRHGKFSSFQRQLNMYGFRKVADCSDRTYSHPFFRRDKPELLAHVRRVVNDPLGTANANASLNAEGNPVAKPAGGAKGQGPLVAAVPTATAKPAGGVNGQGPLVVAVPTATAKEEEKEAKRDGGDESRPARKKTRRVGGVLTSTSSGLSFCSPVLKPKQVSASGGGSAPRGGHVSRNSSPVFPYPSQRQASGGGGGVVATAQHQRHHSSWAQHQRQQQQYHHRRLHEQEQSLQAACSAAAAAGKPNPSRQQFSSSMWHQHTGRWGGETLMTGSGSAAAAAAATAAAGGSSLAEDGAAWTTTSSPASSSVDDVSSPVLLPISPADLDCGSYVPPFRLQPDASTRLPDTRRSRSSIGGVGGGGKLPVPVRPAPGSMSSAAALFGGGGRGGTVDGWNGGVSNSSSVGGSGSYARSSSSVHYSEATTTPHMPGLYGGALKGGTSGNGSNSEADAAGRGAAASAAAIDESNALALGKAFGFGNAISRPASFDLSLDRQEASSSRGDSNQTSRVQPEIPTTNTPGGPHPNNNNNNNNAVVPVTPTAVDGSAWDLACLGGPGWGSPDTSESPAASVWAAIPLLTAADSAAEQAPSSSSSSSSGQTWPVFGGGGGAAVVEGGNNSGGRGVYAGGAHSQYYHQQQHHQQHHQHHQHHQQSRMYNRGSNISMASMFSPPAGGGGHSSSAAAAALNATGNGIGGDSSPSTGAVGLSSLDWALLGDEVADPAAPVASAAPAAFADGGSESVFTGGVDGRGGSRRGSPVYPALAPGAVSGGHL